MRLSEGKSRRMKALANKAGVIAAAAMDQRGSLQKSLAAGKGIDKKVDLRLTLCAPHAYSYDTRGRNRSARSIEVEHIWRFVGRHRQDCSRTNLFVHGFL